MNKSDHLKRPSRIYRKSLQKRKPKAKSLRTLKAKAWALFSEWVRRKDADEGGTVACYTCGKLMFWKEAHAGHAIPGRHNAVLLDEDIVRPQCPRDNIFMGGRYEIFTAKLIRENGLEWFENKLAGARQVVKYTRSDLEDLIQIYRRKLASLGVGHD
jgi:hypothetical protein